MAELFLGPVIDKLFNICSDYLQDKFNCQTHMKKELDRLRENHLKIQAVVFAASQVHILDQNPALNKWMWQLRDAIDEADDLFDDFEYMKHEQQLVTNTEKETKVCRSQRLLLAGAQKLRRVGENCLKKDPNLDRLEEVVQKLDRVSADVSTFHYLIESAKKEQQEQQDELHKARETGFLPAKDFIGRGEDMEYVIQWLMQPSNEEHQTHISTATSFNNISLLSIVGHGGMGKTTLLQHVYEEYQITKGFDLKMWVCVSNNFDVKKVIGDMLEFLKKERSSLEALPALQESLKSEVISKKFLLILDDIWGEDAEGDKSKWEKVLAPLAGGVLGSKVLITTRMDSVASMIAKVINKKKEARKLEGLEEGECLKLLTTHAFVGVENMDDHKILRSIAGELVKKLSGSPLAAKVMGGVLSFDLDERHWRKVLYNKLGQNDIFSILKLSYIFLSKHIQNCFAFCSIFPQDYNFDKDDLVRMWIAVGFIQSSNNQEDTLEDIGEKYFEVLVRKSFFDKYNGYYKMHDLLHELAQFVSNQDCFRDAGDEKLLLKAPETIRHLSIERRNLRVLRNGRFKNLRTLRITNVFYYKDDTDIDSFDEIFKVTSSIRLLELQCKWSCEAPNVNIEYLKHLRFLRYMFHVTRLPGSLTKLYHLQFILGRYSSGDNDDFFPRDMNNLSNLRYINYPELKFSGIGKLKFLQNLIFNVENEVGYRIEELKHMNDLCILRINHLENTRDATEACNAELCYKKKLTNLSLNWSSGIYNRQNIVNPGLDDERLLDNLKPHNCLKELYMNSYMGVRSAVWMNQAHLIKNLKEINLSNCLEWQILPPFSQLPFLKILSLTNMPQVKRLDNKFPGNDNYCGFPSLEKLHISKLEALEDLFDVGVDSWFPCLTELNLYNCPNLQELPYLPPKLVTLRIENIGGKTFKCIITTVRKVRNLITLEVQKQVETIPNGQLKLESVVINDPSVLQMELFRNVVSISELRVENNDELISFSSEAKRWFLQGSSSVDTMNFWYLRSLKSLPSSLTRFSSLGILKLQDLPQLQKLPHLPASMKQLELYCLESLQCLPSSLSTISSLNHLQLYDIPLLKSLPELPPSLCTLDLDRLDNLECLPACLSSLSSLKRLSINRVRLLRELPILPSSLEYLVIRGCRPKLVKRGDHFTDQKDKRE